MNARRNTTTRRAKHLLLIGVGGHAGGEVARGILAYCHRHGTWDFHLGRDNSPETVRRARAAVSQWKADGIIAQVRTRRVGKLCVAAHGLSESSVTYETPGGPGLQVT